MTQHSERTHALPSRATLRARFSGALRFQYGRELGGHANLLDVGLGGISMTTNARLKVGAPVLIELASPRGEGFAELKGKVVWQRNTKSGAHVGIKVYEDDETARIALADCLQAAMKEQSSLAGLRGRQRVLVDLALASKAAQEQPSVWQRLRPAVQMNTAKVATAGF